jgi:integrase
MSKPFPFSEAKIKAISPPPSGRVYHRDARFPGLQLCVTSTGTKTYYFVKRMDGKPTRVLLGTVERLSVESARTAAGAVTGDLAAGRDPQQERRARKHQPSVKDLFDHWLLYAKAHKKASSVNGDQWLYDRYLQQWEHRRLGTIKKADVQAHHAKVGRDNGIYAANRMLSLLRAMFNKAEELGYRGPNPAKGVKAFKEQSRDRFLQPNELQAFFLALEAEPDIFRHFFALGLLTGARRGNLQTMRWADVDLDNGLWRIPETKGGIPVIVPLVDAALAILRARRETANGSEWVFPGRRGGHLTEPKGSWKRICTAAGLADLRPHDLRRSLGSWMAGQNTSLPIIGRVLGHKTPQATMIYSRLALDPLRDAVDKATTAMLTAGKQTKLLSIESKGGDDGKTN